MKFLDLTLPATALMGLSLSGLSIVGAVSENLLPDPIEGSGYVDGPAGAGEEIIVNWSLVKRTDCPGQSARIWRGPGGFLVVEGYRPTTLPQTQEPRAYQIQTRVPEFAPPGTLLLYIGGSYQCPGSPEAHFELGPVVIEIEETEE